MFSTNASLLLLVFLLVHLPLYRYFSSDDRATRVVAYTPSGRWKARYACSVFQLCIQRCLQLEGSSFDTRGVQRIRVRGHVYLHPLIKRNIHSYPYYLMHCFPALQPAPIGTSKSHAQTVASAGTNKVEHELSWRLSGWMSKGEEDETRNL